MVSIKRIEAGQYSVSDGRMIVKEKSKWYILNGEGKHDFGPVTTLAAAKEYVTLGSSLLGQHNINSAYGRSQTKKEYNAFLAAEAKQGNYLPLFIAIISIVTFAILLSFIQKH